MFQSNYAKAGTPTFVERTVLSHGKRYRVRRNPEYVRPKERGQGVTTQAARAELYFYDGRQPVTKPGEVTRAVEQILGFNYGQFTQIAMIAQGDFLRLLRAPSRERKEIFGKIFNTRIYGRIQAKLREEAGNLEEALSENRKDCLRELDALSALPGSERAEELQALAEKEEDWNGCTKQTIEAVQQELAHAKRIFVKNVSFLIRSDMHSIYIHFPVFHADKSLFNAAFA